VIYLFNNDKINFVYYKKHGNINGIIYEETIYEWKLSFFIAERFTQE